MKKQTTAGFTLLEILAVVTMIGILAAIAAPSWVAFNERQQLNAANNQIYQAMRQAQSQAKLQKESWRVSFRQQSGIVQWAVHKASLSPDAYWQNFAKSVQINNTMTDLGKTNSASPPSGGPYNILFNHKGCPVAATTDSCTNTNLIFSQKITLTNQNSSSTKSCVIVSTRLGAIRIAQDTDCN
jgi:prepilin-type N-terminal cleavage/methylation domain-containing protein